MPQAQEFISQAYIKIDGTAASRDMERGIREVVVDTSLYLPDMFSIQIDDPNLTWMDSTHLEIGKLIEISGKAGGESSATPLTKGVIVTIEPEFIEDSTSVTIRGYDKSHHLHRGKKTRVFQQVTDSDMVSRIAQECGIDVTIDATNIVYEHVFQDNQTDMEFIHDRARRNGYFAYVENDRLYFKQASASKVLGATLEWGQNLSSFQARFTSAEQVAESEVHGWDVKQKRIITGNKTSPVGTPTVNGANHGGQMAARAFSSAREAQEVIHSSPVGTAGEADVLAQSALNERCQTFFQAEGRCLGNPAVRAGKEIDLRGLGNRFSGRYLVTRAVHRFDLSGYTTEFEISGFRANTLRQLLTARQNHNPYGVVVGIVTNVEDPDGLARVKVKFPTITETLESNWARLATPMSGAERGIEFIPEVNDEVLVAFEYNDINRPYILGGLWNGKDKPPEASNTLIGNGGKVQKRIIKSRSGHVITLDDTQSGELISIIDKAGQKVVLNSTSGSEKIEVIDKTGRSKIIMDAAAQSVSIESAMDLKIKANGKVQIDGQTGVAINAIGGNLDMKSNAQTNIQGTATSVQGTGSAEVKSSGILTVQGSLVKIN